VCLGRAMCLEGYVPYERRLRDAVWLKACGAVN
jgi:hypothetical protein